MTQAERSLIERTPRGEFDTRQGIEKIISNKENAELESALKQVSYLRKLYRELTCCELFSFVVEGKYWLPYDGTLHKFAEMITNVERIPNKVLIWDDFKKITQLPDDFITEEVI